MFTFERHDSIDRRADEWVAAGIISPGQAEEIKRFEDDGTESSGRLTVVAELAAYFGSVLALMGGAVFVGRRWDDIGIGERSAIAAGIAIVGFLAGRWLVQQHESGTDRLGAFMWVVGAGGWAMLVGLVVDEYGPDRSEWAAVAVGVALAAVGVGLWRNLDRPLQLLTAATGVLVAFLAAADLVGLRVWVGGTVFIVLGSVVAIAAAAGRLRPRLVGIVVGAVGAYGGAIALDDLDRHLGPVTALVVGLVVVAGALLGREMLLLVLGVFGTLIATQALLATTLSGAASSALVAVLGLVVVIVAIGRTARG